MNPYLKDGLATRLEQKFGMSFVSAITIIECIEGGWKGYAKLPQATTDSLQVICDMYNVSMVFHQTKSKMALTGIFNSNHYEPLPHADADKLIKMKSSTEWHSHPGGDSRLTRVEKKGSLEWRYKLAQDIKNKLVERSGIPADNLIVTNIGDNQ